MLFKDPRLSIALHRVTDLMLEHKPLQTAINKFSALKSGQYNYPGAEKLFTEHSSNLGLWENFSKVMGKARKAIKALIAWEETASQSSIKAALRDYPVLKLIHSLFWKQPYPLWFTGWKDSDKKRLGTMGVGLGWGLLEACFVERKMFELLRDRDLQWLLEATRHILVQLGGRWWWEKQFNVVNLPALLDELPACMLRLD
ncbi:hypothetical protein FRC12_024370 [Ceratobasidium sp. 428]|nr:hypothetical protein FRC12_024370 [Ceratobasidium sp. 428]